MTLTSSALKALDATTPDSDGETLTITATAPSATSDTRTVTYDPTAPALSSVVYGGTKVALTMSEGVYAATAPTATDFKVKSGTSGSETANAVTTITGLPSTAATAADTVTLTVTTAITSGSSVLAYYTKGTNAVTDAAGNALASVAEADAVSADQGSRVSFTPADGGYLVSLSGNSLVGFSSAIYSDNACATALTNATAENLISFKQNSSAGSDISKSVTYANNIITVSPLSDFSDGDVVYVGISNGWYASVGGGCVAGAAASAVFSVDVSAPTVSLASVSDGYVNAAEDDGTVAVVATVTPPRERGAATVTVTDTDGDSVTRVTTKRAAYANLMTDATPNISFSHSAESGRVAIDGNVMAIGMYSDDTGGTNRGAVLLVKDGDNDGDFTDATSSDVIKISNSTTGITLANNDYFGSAVAIDTTTGKLAIGATGTDYTDSDNNTHSFGGAVYIIDDGGDGWASIAASDVVKIDGDTAGVTFTLTFGGYAHFGSGVAIDGGKVYVGASYDRTGGGRTGVMWIIGDGGDGWAGIETTDVTKVSNDTTGLALPEGGRFGAAVAADGGVIAVGSINRDSRRGAVHIFDDKNSDGDWADTGEIVAVGGSAAAFGLVNGDQFGVSVDLDMTNGLLAVGANLDDNCTVSGEVGCGAAYLVDDGGDRWASITADDIIKIDGTYPGLTLAGANQSLGRNIGDLFGAGIALGPHSLAVGASGYGGDNARGAIFLFDSPFKTRTVTLTGDDFEKDATATAGDGKLGAGTLTVRASVPDEAGNPGTDTETLVYDPTAPSLSSVSYSGSTVTLTMSEPVFGTAVAADFIVRDDGTAVTVSSSTLPSDAANATATIDLTLAAAPVTGSVVKVHYTQNAGDTTKRVSDPAGNDLATITSANAVTAVSNVVPTIAFTPTDGGYATSLSGNLSAGFGENIYTDAACSSGMDITGATAILTLKSGGATGTNLAKSVLYAGDTILIDPTADFTDRQTVYMGVSDSWYYKDGANACHQGTAQSAQFTVDVTDPTAVLLPVSGGFVNAAEDDGSVTVSAAVSADTASVSFTVSDGTDTLPTIIAARDGFAATSALSDTHSALSLTDSDFLGTALSRDGDMLAVGASGDDTGGSGRGAVYLVYDSDSDGDFADETGSSITTLSGATAGITLTNGDAFGTSVALDNGLLAVSAVNDDTGGTNRGAVYLIKSGGDRWATVESTDVVKLSDDTTGITLGDSDGFGFSVALESGLLAAGAYRSDTGGSDRGTVYLISDGGDSWGSVAAADVVTLGSATAGITLEDSDRFGSAVALEGGLLAAGAYHNNTGGGNAGAVWLIADGGDGWGSVAASDVVKISNDTAGITLTGSDEFGRSVSLGDGLLAVGAPGDDTGGSGRGAVYLIESGGDQWGSVAASDVSTVGSDTTGLSLQNNDGFGTAVALGGGVLAAGAPLDDTGGTNRGRAHLFSRMYSGSLVTGDFEKDGTPTDDSALGAGSVSVSVSLTDNAGNTGTGSGSFVYDPVVPTISSAFFIPATSSVYAVMSEDVFAPAALTASDFKVKSGTSGSETANVVTAITGLPSTAATADSALTLTVTTAFVTGDSVKVYYTKGTNAVTDAAGNEIASLAEGSALSATETVQSVSVSAVSTDDYINDAEDESAVLITGSSTGLVTGTSVSIAVDDADADSTANHTFTATTDADGAWTTAVNDLTSARLKAFVEGDITITASSTGATSGTRTVTYDPTAPTATYTTGTGGGVVSGTDTLLNIGDSVSVTAAFSESVTAAPTVQMKNNGTNLGSAVTGVASATVYSFSGASADTGTSSDPYDFGNPDATTGIAREALGGGFVYKTTRAFDSLYLHALGTVNAGTAFRARYHTSKPTASTVDSAGTQLWTSNSYRNNVAGGGLMSNVPSGTYFWVYPSASANRALSNRSMTIVSGAGSGDTVSFSSGTLSAQDTAGTNDPYDFGALTGVSGIERETLGSGYVYKTTKPFAVLSALVQGNVQTNGTTTVSGRHHTSKPTAATVSTAGTEFLSTTSTSQNTPIAAQSAIRAIPAGSYFWFHPDKAGWMSNRVLHLTGTAADTSGSVYTATYAVASGTTVTSGNLQYDITNEASVVDTAGNPLAAKAATTIPNVAVDGVAPTITSGTYAETAITLTMSEAVYGTAEANDFTIVNDSGGTPANVTPTAITLAADAATAGTTVSLTAPVTAWTGTVKLYYTQDSNATKRVYDTAGNPLASLASASAITLGETAVAAAFLPADNGYLTALSGNLTIDFSGAVYSDSACATRLTNTTAGNITALKQNNNSGSAITHTASYSTTDNVITLNPSSDFTEGAVAFVSLTNGWYYSVGGTCTQGSAGTATVTVDATAPTVVSGSTGYYSDSGLANALSGIGRRGERYLYKSGVLGRGRGGRRG